MIILMILLALANGFIVVVSRLVNARLGKEIGSLGASIWNHMTGALLMGIIFLLMNSKDLFLESIPFYAFLGGVIGAVYVTISNFIIPKIGASKATILMIAGQMCVAAFIDLLRDFLGNRFIALLGIILIIFGVYIGEKTKKATTP